VSVSATTITLTSGTGVVDASDIVTILIGENATGGVANSQITNPSVGSYSINISAGSADTGETRVAIVDPVTSTVETILTFTVQGTSIGTNVNGVEGDETRGITTATTIPLVN